MWHDLLRWMDATTIPLWGLLLGLVVGVALDLLVGTR
jgi:hypothetical protein